MGTASRVGAVRPLPGHLRRPGGTVGVAADERFAVVLNNITKARRQRYNAAYRAPPQDDAVVVAARLARAAYMRDYRSRPRTEEAAKAARAGRAAYMKRYRATKTEAGNVRSTAV